MQVEVKAIEEAVLNLLLAIGEDPIREDLENTPRRVAQFYAEFMGYSDNNLDTVFYEAMTADEMVILKGIPFASLCAHHLLPFYGHAAIGYITGDEVLGASKFARLVQVQAHKLQVQERMAREIADGVQKLCPTALGVGVLLEAKHTCMSMRGIRSPGSMITSVLRGPFRDCPDVRSEFLTLVRT